MFPSEFLFDREQPRQKAACIQSYPRVAFGGVLSLPLPIGRMRGRSEAERVDAGIAGRDDDQEDGLTCFTLGGRRTERWLLGREKEEEGEEGEDARRSCMQIPSVHLRGILPGSVED